MSKYLYPQELKKLKACTQCHLIKTDAQFRKEGCENCKISKNAIEEKITGKFKGMIAITDPKKSWAAKYLDKGKYFFYYNFNLAYCLPGFYALGIYDEKGYDQDY